MKSNLDSFENEQFSPSELNLFFEPVHRLRLTIANRRSYLAVKPTWASPLSHPNRYLSLLNSKGEEIIMVSDLTELDEASQKAVREELHRRYLTADIQSILHVKSEYGVTYWTVATDRGEREFVTQSLQENAQWLSDGHLLLIDVDGNRFEIRNIGSLDDQSQRFIEVTL